MYYHERNHLVYSTTNAYAQTRSAYNGVTIRQYGENQVYMGEVEYYASQEDRDAGQKTYDENLVFDVQYEQGIAYIEVPYIEQEYFEETSERVELPYYDPNLEPGTSIPAECDFFTLMGFDLTFFGESSDEFLLITFDIVLKQGTPAGTYSVNLDSAVDESKGMYTGLTNSSVVFVEPASLNGFTIVVDKNTPPAETTTTTEATITTETTTTSETVIYQPDPLLLETEKTLYVGQSAEITAYNVGNNKIVWVSSDSNVLSVAEGSADATATIRGVSPGTTTMVALVGNGSNTKFLMCEVTVLPAESTSILCGDVNCDGYVALNDVILLMKYTGRFVEFEDSQLENAEYNGDGQVNANDALVLLKFLSQKIDSLPYDG
ncbi:MAG: dockerin type I domain-containing protein [Ruminococcus sp.]|nr:dockerin type I domain-containing protein [Ruminococcus sp.]